LKHYSLEVQPHCRLHPRQQPVYISPHDECHSEAILMLDSVDLTFTAYQDEKGCLDKPLHNLCATRVRNGPLRRMLSELAKLPGYMT
jgi:hypothetical protein